MIRATEEDQKQQVITELRNYLKGEHPYTVRSIQEVIDILEKSKGSERECVENVTHFTATYLHLLTVIELSLQAADIIEDRTGLYPWISYRGPVKNTPFYVNVSLPTTNTAYAGIMLNPNISDYNYEGRVEEVVNTIINDFAKSVKKYYSNSGDKGKVTPQEYADQLMQDATSEDVSDSAKLQSWIESLVSTTYRRNKKR